MMKPKLTSLTSMQRRGEQLAQLTLECDLAELPELLRGLDTGGVSKACIEHELEQSKQLRKRRDDEATTIAAAKAKAAAKADTGKAEPAAPATK